MASKSTDSSRVAAPHVFDCESIPIAPGTKNRLRLPRELDQPTSSQRHWWLLGAAVVAALLAGVAIGRFVLS